MPLWQLSPSVQFLPSSQLTPSFAGTFVHLPLMHVPMLQGSVNDAQSAADTQGPAIPVLELDIAPPAPPAPPDDPLPLDPPWPESSSMLTAVAQATGAAHAAAARV